MAGSEFPFRILLIGDATVGKTSLLLRFVDNSFSVDNVSTKGANVKTRTVQFAKKTVKLDIVDTCGQEIFKTISRSIYHNADAVVVVYDPKNPKSFENIPAWLKETDKFANLRHCQKFIAANKSDLADYSCAAGEAKARELGLPFFSTSAKMDVSVNEMFQRVVQSLGPVLYKEEDWNKFKIGAHPSTPALPAAPFTGSSSSSSSGSNSNQPPKKRLCTIL